MICFHASHTDLLLVDLQEWFPNLLRTTRIQVSWDKFRIPPANHYETEIISLCVWTNAGSNLTSDGWIKWKDSQYYINDIQMGMDDARHYCKQRNGDLVSIYSKDENTFIWKQVSFTNFLFNLKTKCRKNIYCLFTFFSPYYSHSMRLQISRKYGSFYIGMSVGLDGSLW